MDLTEALAKAIDYERQVRDHYAKCSKLTVDPHGKRVFAILAREEQGHLEHLESRQEEWLRTGAVTALDVPTILPPVAHIEAEALKAAAAPRPAAVPGSGMPELDFLKEALELERKTSGFYQEMVSCLEPRWRPLFDRFLEIEDGHVTIVQAEIDSLVGHGHWFDFMEFSLEG
jgi:rubrerythrin